MALDPFEGGDGLVAVGLESGDPLPQHVVQIGEAFFDKLVKSPELFLRGADFSSQRFDPRLNFGIGLQPVVGDGLEQSVQPVWKEDSIGDMFGDELVVSGEGPCIMSGLHSRTTKGING